MAKLKAPLFSLGASGQIGKALVYFPWKGLNLVREHVSPSNPNTSGQSTQRGYLTNSVTRIHWAQARATFPLVAADVSAYALWGSIFATPRTWFNQIVKNMIDQQVDTNEYPAFYAGTFVAGANQIQADIYAHLGFPTAGAFWYGTSKTALINSIAANIAGAHIDATIVGLTTGVKYYVQFRPSAGDPADGSRSGIYYATPT